MTWCPELVLSYLGIRKLIGQEVFNFFLTHFSLLFMVVGHFCFNDGGFYCFSYLGG